MIELYLNALICICDESYEKTEHHVDEERDERVEVDPAEEPHHGVLLLELRKRLEHVVPVHQGEEAFGHTAQTLKLAPAPQIHADIQETTQLIPCLKNYVQENKQDVIFAHLLHKLDVSMLSRAVYKCCHLESKAHSTHLLYLTFPKNIQIQCQSAKSFQVPALCSLYLFMVRP